MTKKKSKYLYHNAMTTSAYFQNHYTKLASDSCSIQVGPT